MKKQKRLWDTYHYPGFKPKPVVTGVFGDPQSIVVKFDRPGKKRYAAFVAKHSMAGMIASSVRFGIFLVAISGST
jgi:hypothetical protein